MADDPTEPPVRTVPKVAARVEIAVTGVPEMLVLARHELAQVLMETALDEDPRVAARLREIAAIFETGQSEDL